MEDYVDNYRSTPSVLGVQVKQETVTDKLRRTIERARELTALSDRLAFRVAGPRPEPNEKNGPSVGSPEDNDILLRLADELDSVIRQIGRNVEYAHSRV